MSDHPVDFSDGAPQGVPRLGAHDLVARAARAGVRLRRTLHAEVRDFSRSQRERLDERTRAMLGDVQRMIVTTIESAVREHACRQLRDRTELADALSRPDAGRVLRRLRASGVLYDFDLMAELLALVRLDMLARGLPPRAPEEADRPSLINRFVQHSDRVVAAGAMTVLIAESRRRTRPDSGMLPQTDLPAALHARLVWHVAAALREQFAQQDGKPECLPVIDAAIIEAAERNLTAFDADDRLEAAAMRLAEALDPHPDELDRLLLEALGDRRLALFTAILAQAAGVAFDVARDIVLDPAADRLWVVLRALNLQRETIAHIGYALSEADGRRDLELFAEQIDTIMALDCNAARDALAPLRLPTDYRAAIMALERADACE